ncbi:MAG: thioredoxin [Euryarchaeota archaeon]|nr:thioredoxin [Euryarchaeota archaeon]
MGEVRAVTDSEFEATIGDNEWVLVDFWAEWCGPCKAIAPILNDIIEGRDLLVAKVDTDKNNMHAARLGVRGIPALFLFNNGQLVAQQSGMMTKDKLTTWVDNHMTAHDF